MEDTSPRHHENVEVLARHLEGVEVAMMSTVSPEGRIHSRPMAAQELPFDGELWFFTSRDMPVAEEIRRNPKVNLSYGDRRSHRFVSVSGHAELVDDMRKASELWNSVYKTWFPRGLDDPELTLIRVRVEHAEIWDPPSRPMTLMLSFARSVMTGKPYEGEPPEHQWIDLTG